MPFAATVAGTARRPALALILGLLVLLGGTSSTPAPVAAATSPASIEASLLAWTNRDRAAIGLRPLRLDGRLAAIADERAANLVAAASLSHQAAGASLSTTLDRAGVQWYAWAENIGWWGGGPTIATASALYGAWRGSAHHWAALMSPSLNYVGFGVAHRPSDGRLFGCTVFTESRDRTAPRAKVETATRDGTNITFTWRGWDPVLQSHGAGLRDFDVWYRVDAGAWRLVRDNTTATSLRLTGRASGHRYWLAVRPRDRALNIGPLSSPISAWVP
jgi:uncharacterized protein YkwD